MSMSIDTINICLHVFVERVIGMATLGTGASAAHLNSLNYPPYGLHCKWLLPYSRQCTVNLSRQSVILNVYIIIHNSLAKSYCVPQLGNPGKKNMFKTLLIKFAVQYLGYSRVMYHLFCSVTY